MMFQTLARAMKPGELLRIECEGCGRRGAWTRPEAFARLGADSTPADVRRKLRCDGCGRRGAARVWL